MSTPDTSPKEPLTPPQSYADRVNYVEPWGPYELRADRDLDMIDLPAPARKRARPVRIGDEFWIYFK